MNATTNKHPTSTATTHLVIGDGITALAFVEQVTLHQGDRLIILGEQASELGRGLAYATGEAGTPWRFAYLLNSPADDIDPAFAKWLQERWDWVEATMKGRTPNWLAAAKPLIESGDFYGVNAPREFYGDFMRELVETSFARLRAQGVRVTTIDACATLIESDDHGAYSVQTSTGQTLLVDSIDIAPGGPSTMRIEGDEGPFAAPSVFGHEQQIAEHIKAGAEIFCVGGNAAMLDVLRLCQSLIPDDELRFIACAPDGEIPAPLIPRLPRKFTSPRLSKGHNTAESFLAELWDQIEAAKDAGDEMREIRAGFRAHFLDNPLSNYIEDIEQARLVPAKLRFWLRGGTRDTILDLRSLVEAGKAQMMTGFVTAIEHLDDGALVHLSDGNGNGNTCTHRTGFVVNCAGAGRTSRHDPLTESLLQQGAIDKNASGGLVVGPKCATAFPSVRYLSPAVSQIGDEIMAMPLYDAHMLRTYARRATS